MLELRPSLHRSLYVSNSNLYRICDATNVLRLSCGHLHCGGCLEVTFKAQLNARLDDPDGTWYGVPLKLIKQSISTGPEGVMRSLYLVPIVDHDFTTYKSPCCQQPISRPPRTIYALKNIANHLGDGHGALHQKYFAGLFLLR